MARTYFSKTLLFSVLLSCNIVFCMQQSVNDNGVFFEKNTSTNLGASVIDVSAKCTEIETPDITEILKHTDIDEEDSKNILVIFDIDGVVMIPQQLLGNDPWAYYEGDKYIAKYNNGTVKGASKEAFKNGMDEFKPVWSFVQKHVQVKLVDDKFKTVLQNLFKNCIKVMGFTARGMDLVERTKYQMDSVGINFSKNVYSKDNTEIGENVNIGSQDFECEDYIYKNGVLFVNLGVSKGEILNKFFEKIGKKPKKIIFIDDQPKNIKTIRAMCEKEKISFVGLRYSGADDIVKLDDKKKKICDCQLKHLNQFGVVLSDQDAEDKLGLV